MTWNKPLPMPTPTTAPYWDGLKAHEVRIQQCAERGHWVFFPRIHCPVCASRNLVWRTVSGEGKLYTFTVARIPTMPEFADEMPQILAVVELDEGPHINTNIVGADPSSLKVGQRVRPVFDDRPGTYTLLRYTPVESSVPRVISAQAAA
ncbi:MAG TPA: Zn-ribbon domain-containing OB-fold protein [Candidatus Binataceae bacterium]|nr:Zn-ribbon domain-containing OB-fold protein [Candidatus Binataceae bacterium]